MKEINQEVVKLSIEQVIPYAKNPRINTKAIDKVKRSIEEWGYIQLIIVDQNNVICAGHTRYIALCELGYEEIEVQRINMSRKEFIGYMVADNKTNEYSEWENDLLIDIADEYRELGGDISALGFSDEAFNALMDSSDIDSFIGSVQEPAKPTNVSNKRIKQVQIFLNETTFPIFIEMCEKIQGEIGKENLTDTIYACVERVYNASS